MPIDLGPFKQKLIDAIIAYLGKYTIADLIALFVKKDQGVFTASNDEEAAIMAALDESEIGS